jgi:hypothetical protein
LSRTPAQVVIRWALQRGMVAIPRSSDAGHMEDNLEVFDFDLDEDHMGRINGLDGTRAAGAGGAGSAATASGGGGAAVPRQALAPSSAAASAARPGAASPAPPPAAKPSH